MWAYNNAARPWRKPGRAAIERKGLPTMTGYMKSRPTLYKGIRMRSRLEASFAAYLDAEGGAPWTYEPQCFADATGQYLPDFCARGNTVVAYYEVKPPTAETGVALRKMHIIRASDPAALLFVVVPTGTYPNQGWATAGSCLADRLCVHCDDGTYAFQDTRTIPGANRRVVVPREPRVTPTDPRTGRATIGGRARRDVATDLSTGRATIGGRAKRDFAAWQAWVDSLPRPDQ